MTSSKTAGKISFSGYQKLVVGILAFLQFTIVLDFMLLSPLGAVLMPALHITPAQFGLVVSVYAFGAGISGVCTAGFADRFDRKKLLLVFYAGFITGTFLCAIASSYGALLFARAVTGVFSGVVGSVCFAIITDLFPMQLRGRVMGITQTAFAASTILGLPVSLLMSSQWGWNAPFFLVVAICLVVGVVVVTRLKPVDEHLKNQIDRSAFRHLLHTVTNRRYIEGFVSTGFISIGGFMLMPFVSAFNVYNVGVPFASLSLLYLISGGFSALTGPLIGKSSDAFGKYRVFLFGCFMTIVMVLIYTHMSAKPLWYLAIVTVLMQIGIFCRMISASALLSGVPSPPDRGAYGAITSSLQQLAGGIAAIVAGQIVVELPGGSLLHFDRLGYILVATTLISLALITMINRRMKREAAVPLTLIDPVSDPAVSAAMSVGE